MYKNYKLVNKHLQFHSNFPALYYSRRQGIFSRFNQMKKIDKNVIQSKEEVLYIYIFLRHTVHIKPKYFIQSIFTL
jgi:hypothetical protein